MSYPIPSAAMKAAMDAHKDLNLFAALAAILEGGTVGGSNTAVTKIITICHAEQQRQLRLLDKAVAKANAEKST